MDIVISKICIVFSHLQIVHDVVDLCGVVVVVEAQHLLVRELPGIS